MDEAELWERVRQAFAQSAASQSDLARELDLNRSTVSRALRNEGRKHAAAQARILSFLTEKPVERRTIYRGQKVRHSWVIPGGAPLFNSF